MRVLILVSQTEKLGDRADARTIADALVARGHEVVIVAETLHGPTQANNILVKPGQPSILERLKYAARLLRLIRSHRIQVVHAYTGTANRWTRLTTRLAGAPMTRIIQPFESGGPGPKTESKLPECLDAEGVNSSLSGAQALDLVVNRLELAYRSTFVKFYRREIPILCYHRLVESAAECGKFDTHLHVDLFEKHLRYLRDHGYRTLHFADLSTAMAFEKTHRAVILSFDDGYEDNYRLLFPLLKKYGVKAVVYLVSGREANDWDVARGEQSFRLMSHSQRQEMLDSELVEFGAHTISHPDLTAISQEQVDEEIQQSKIQLEADLGVVVETFAYPYGRLNDHVKRSVRRAGFRYGVATHSGPVAFHEDPFHVRRIVVFPSTTLRRFKRKVSGSYANIVSSRANRDAEKPR